MGYMIYMISLIISFVKKADSQAGGLSDLTPTGCQGRISYVKTILKTSW